MSTVSAKRNLVQVQQATVRFAGDSGDGMQLVGSQFADLSSILGNVICTMPDYPSEIRAPAGSLAGVSGYQLNFGGQEVTTPGDCAVRAHRHESGGAEGQSGRPAAGRDHRRQRGRVHAGEPGEGRATTATRWTTVRSQGINVIRVPMTRLNEDAVKHTGLVGRSAAAARTSLPWASRSGCTIGRSSRRSNG